MDWELIIVGNIEWTQDDSGYYSLIHYVKDDIVRIDFMNRDDMPVVSFQGMADNVRKAAMQWIDNKFYQWTTDRMYCEHASYIGAELARCEIFKENYVQG